MRWSIKIGQYRGIGVYVHATFLLLLALVGYLYWQDSKDLWKTAEGVLFILALFGCVLLHEFGHALAAAGYGIKTKDITLLPIGGVARLERMPREPLQELWVAVAGPLVNVVIAIAIAVWLLLRSAFEPLEVLSITKGDFLYRIMLVNIILVVFNMLPAFPMDGGRVLRALLATRLNYVQATQIAANVGQAMALLFGLAGILMSNPLLVFIAFFVWIGAAQESGATEMQGMLDGIPVSAATITDFRILRPQDTLNEAIDLIISGSQQDFPVIDETLDRLVGILTRQQLLTSLGQNDRSISIADVMQTEFETVELSETLFTAFDRLQSCNCRTMPVMSRGKLVGLLTMDNLGEFLALRSALSKRKK